MCFSVKEGEFIKYRMTAEVIWTGEYTLGTYYAGYSFEDNILGSDR